MYTIKIEEKIQFAYGFKVVKDYGTFDIPGHIVVKGHVYYYNPETQLTVECFANDGYVKPTELTMS